MNYLLGLFAELLGRISPDAVLTILVFAPIVGLVLSLLVADAGYKKGRSWFAGFGLSVLLSPIIGGIIVGLLATDDAELKRREERQKAKGPRRALPPLFANAAAPTERDAGPD